MLKRLIPFATLFVFLFVSCGDDSPNSDINKEWTLIDLTYSGTTTADTESFTFEGQLVGGNARMQFEEEPNTVRSIGSYTIQLENKLDNDVSLSQQNAVFDQFGTWMRNGNVISTSADNSFDTDLQILNVSDDKLDLGFDFSITTDFSGVPVVTRAQGIYFLASADYISGWKDVIKGGWKVSDVELTRYNGTFSSIDGIVDKVSTGKYTTGNAPLEFGNSGEFRASGFYSMDINSVEFDFGTGETLSSSKESEIFLVDGTYSINDKELVITQPGGANRNFTIIDANEESLTFYELIEGVPNGPFGIIDSRSRVVYTLIKEEYIPAPTNSSVLGTWNLSDFNSELTVQLFTLSVLVSESNGVAEFISSSADITISENPNTISTTGSYLVNAIQTEDGITTEEMRNEELFSATDWTLEDDVLQAVGGSFDTGSGTFSIDLLSANELVITEMVDFTVESFDFEIKTTGFRTFSFIR